MNCPTGPSGCAELKLDGYRAVALKTAGQVHLHSRNDNDLDLRYLAIVRAPAHLPYETVIDGEIVACSGFGWKMRIDRGAGIPHWRLNRGWERENI